MESWEAGSQTLTVDEFDAAVRSQQQPLKAPSVAPWEADSEVVDDNTLRRTATQETMKDIARARMGLPSVQNQDVPPAWFPNVTAWAQGLGSSVVAPIARALGAGDRADYLQMWGAAYREAAAERDIAKNKVVPPIISRGVRGAAESLPPMIIAGQFTGPYGALAVAGGMEADKSITEGRMAGLEGGQLAAYAGAQGAIEASVGMIFQRLGLGGTEALAAAKPVVRQTLGETLKRLGIAAVQELPEEIVTEIGHNVTSALANVDPNAVSAESIQQTIADTTVQTLITVGAIGSPQVVSDVATGRQRAQRLAELKAIRAKGYVSAEDGQTAGIDGTTRKERLANTDAEIQQLEQEAQNAPSVPEAETEVRAVEGGQDVRGQGEVEVPAEPAGQVAEAPEVPVEPVPDERAAMLEALAAAEGLELPDVLRTEEAAEPAPQRDVAAELREALTGGPVTVTTPEVQSGFKVRRVRDDGKVVTTRGRVLTPDETWVVQKPAGKPPEAPASPQLAPQQPEATEPAPTLETPPQAAGKAGEGVVAPAPATQKSRGRKPVPPPELAQAGSTIKSTPKGWSVTGIPEEIADGLKIDYQGRNTGSGYFFKSDPTAGLVDAARTIAAEAEFDAAERAQGRRRTSIGYLEEETAGAFEQERGERLKLAKELVAQRNAGVDELLSQFVPKGKRGQFKLALLRAEEKGDADTIKAFDQMVEYAKDHPELGLPQNETELFEMLTGESFTKDDATLLDEIDRELAAELESFDFGANVPAEVKQTAIPGTEQAVAAQEQREEYQRAPKPEKRKEKQKAFISGLGKDLPGQETMFDVDGLDGGEDAGPSQAAAPPKPSPSPKTKLQQAADKATQEAFDELDSFGKLVKGKGLALNAPLDPEVIAGAGRVVAKFTKAGTLKFAALIEKLTTAIGQAAVDRIRPALEAEWNKLQQSGEVDGMEPIDPPQAAAAAEGDSNLTSIKNEIVNELRQKRGIQELPEVPAQTREEWMDAAAQRIAESKGTIGPSLVAEINKNPRNLSNIEVAVLQVYYRGVNNAFESASEQLFQAVEGKNPVAIAVAQTEADNLLTELDSIEQATKAAGREWGRAGVARQIMLAKDFSLAAMTRKARVANGGKPLSTEQAEEIAKLAKQVADLEKQLAESEAKREDLERERRVQEGIDKDQQEVKKQKVYKKSKQREKAEANVAAAWAEFETLAKGKLYSAPVELAIPAVKVIKAYVELGIVTFSEFMATARKHMGTDNAEKAKATFQAAWDDMKTKGELPTIELDDNAASMVTRFARQIQRTLVEAGVTKRDEVVDAVHEALKEIDQKITRRETMDALSGYGQFSQLSKDEIDRIIRDINGQLQQLAKLEDMQAGKAPAKTGPERRTPSDEERRLIQQVNEAKKRGGFNVVDPERQLKTALDAAKTAIRNRIADLEHEIRTKERIVRQRTELKPDTELEALRKQRDELREAHQTLFPPPQKKLTDVQRIASAVRAADKAIAQLEQQLETRNFDQERRSLLSSPELDAKRARLEQLRAAREAAKALELSRMEGEGGAVPGKKPLSQEEKSRRAYKASLKKRIADLEQRLANNEFSPAPKKEPRALTREELDLKRKLDDVKHDFFDKVAQYRLANMSPLEKAWDYAKETAHLSRAAMTSIDFSAVFRQGGAAVFSHPRMALKAGRKMLSAFASRQAEFDSVEEIRNRPNAQLYETSRLAITEEEGRLTRQEEAFMGRWGKRFAPIRASSRAYTTFLNNLRADLFDLMVENLGRSGAVTLDEAKVIARYVNVATGRADLGQYNAAMANLNTVFFAPRYVASRFQYLFMPLYLPFTKTSGRVKRAIAMEYGRHAAGVGAFMALAVGLGALLAGDDDDERPTIEFDPRSSDFGKIKIGETRIDPLSGLAQTTVFLSRLASGQTKTASGEIRPLRGSDVKFGQPTTTDVIKRFVWSKLAPVPGSAVDLLEGENVVGEKRTPAGVVAESFLPLSFREIADTMRARGIPAGTAISLLNILGMGTATYGPRTQYMTGTAEERQSQIEKDLKSLSWDYPEPAYAEFLTDEQREQFKARRQEKRGLVIHNATYAGKDPETLVTRDKNREYLQQMKAEGVTLDEARQLLKDYYRRPNEKGKRGSLTEGYFQKLRALNRLYAE